MISIKKGIGIAFDSVGRTKILNLDHNFNNWCGALFRFPLASVSILALRFCLCKE